MGFTETQSSLCKETDAGFQAVANKADQIHRALSAQDINLQNLVKLCISKTVTNQPIKEQDSSNSSLNMLASDRSPFSPPMRLQLFPDNGETAFSLWLRRFEDYADAQAKLWTPEEKTKRLKVFLDCFAGEMYENFEPEVKSNYNPTKSKLKKLFESPKMLDLSRQRLLLRFHKSGESVNAFTERLGQVVGATCIGHDQQDFGQILKEQFLDRLEPVLMFS